MDRRAFLLTAAIAGPALAAQKKKKMSDPIVLSPRQRLGGTLDLYVNADSGDDAANGWSWATAKRNPQNAYEYGRSNFDMNGYGMRLNLANAAARYKPLNAVGHLVGAHIFNVQGNDAEPQACLFEGDGSAPCIWVQDYAGAVISGVSFIGAGDGIQARQHGLVDYQNCAFWPMTGSHVHVVDLSIASCVGREIIYGGASVHWDVGAASKLNIAGSVVTLNSALAFNYFLSAQGAGAYLVSTATFGGAGVGACSGLKGIVQLNAVAMCGNNVPGNSVTASGTQPGTGWLVQYGGIRQ